MPSLPERFFRRKKVCNNKPNVFQKLYRNFLCVLTCCVAGNASNNITTVIPTVQNRRPFYRHDSQNNSVSLEREIYSLSSSAGSDSILSSDDFDSSCSSSCTSDSSSLRNRSCLSGSSCSSHISCLSDSGSETDSNCVDLTKIIRKRKPAANLTTKATYVVDYPMFGYFRLDVPEDGGEEVITHWANLDAIEDEEERKLCKEAYAKLPGRPIDWDNLKIIPYRKWAYTAQEYLDAFKELPYFNCRYRPRNFAISPPPTESFDDFGLVKLFAEAEAKFGRGVVTSFRETAAILSSSDDEDYDSLESCSDSDISQIIEDIINLFDEGQNDQQKGDQGFVEELFAVESKSSDFESKKVLDHDELLALEEQILLESDSQREKTFISQERTEFEILEEEIFHNFCSDEISDKDNLLEEISGRDDVTTSEIVQREDDALGEQKTFQ